MPSAIESTLRTEEPAALLRPWRGRAGSTHSAAREFADAPPRIKLRYRERSRQPQTTVFLELRVQEFMSRDLTAIHTQDLVQHAALVMAHSNRAALPVSDDSGALVGLLTDRDIVLRAVARGRDPLSTLVADCMTCEPYTCRADTWIVDCLLEMRRREVACAPVVDGNGSLVGIVSTTDVERHAAATGHWQLQQAITEISRGVEQQLPA